MTNDSESYIEDLTVDNFEIFLEQQEGFQRAYVKKIRNHVNLLVTEAKMHALNFSMCGVLDTRNKSKTHDCERNLSPMILKGNQMMYF